MALKTLHMHYCAVNCLREFELLLCSSFWENTDDSCLCSEMFMACSLSLSILNTCSWGHTHTSHNLFCASLFLFSFLLICLYACCWGGEANQFYRQVIILQLFEVMNGICLVISRFVRTFCCCIQGSLSLWPPGVWVSDNFGFFCSLWQLCSWTFHNTFPYVNLDNHSFFFLLPLIQLFLPPQQLRDSVWCWEVRPCLWHMNECLEMLWGSEDQSWSFENTPPLTYLKGCPQQVVSQL